MNNSPANVEGVGRFGVDLVRRLPSYLRFLCAFLIVGTALAATSASGQGRVFLQYARGEQPGYGGHGRHVQSVSSIWIIVGLGGG